MSEMCINQVVFQEKMDAMKNGADAGVITGELWEMIAAFGHKVAKDMMWKYSPSASDMEDVMSELTCTFFAMLSKYDPYRTAPTTFFKYYFMETVREFINCNYRHMTGADAQRFDKIKKYMDKMQKEGVSPSMEEITRETGYSEKIVKRLLAHRTDYVRSTDEANVEDLMVDESTPEVLCTYKDCVASIVAAANKVLSQEERLMFFRWINPDGDKYVQYKYIAAEFGMTPSTARKRLEAMAERIRKEIGG